MFNKNSRGITYFRDQFHARIHVYPFPISDLTVILLLLGTYLSNDSLMLMVVNFTDHLSVGGMVVALGGFFWILKHRMRIGIKFLYDLV